MKNIVAITGSREYLNNIIVRDKLNILNNYLKITKIIHGGAKGPDRESEFFALNNNTPFEVIYPDWDKHGKKAGMLRNIDIIRNANIILAFWDKKSKGTKHTIDLSIKVKKNIITFDMYGNVIKELSFIFRYPKYEYKWSRVVKRGEPYYECSSKGNKSYSALYAFLDGISIEEIYQLDIKGYRGKVKHWKEAKGLPSLIEYDDVFKEYTKLWIKYFKLHPELYDNILKEARGKTITDMFGVRDINQARAICYLCNNGLII